MSKSRSSTTAPRKMPKQARSARLVEAIVQAAVRVLERDGAAAFTTIRVAERAGVSVGSLYQYFPNKASILLRLQEDEWATTGQLLEGIFTDERLAPADRLRSAMHAFFRSECDEAPLRRALGEAAPLYRDSPAAQRKRERGMPRLRALIEEVAPHLPRRRSAFVADFYITTMTSIGKQVSETNRTPAEVDAWASATADMFLAYLHARNARESA